MEYNLKSEKMGRSISQSRMLLISTLLICALIIALGIVLGLKIYNNDDNSLTDTQQSVQETVTTTRAISTSATQTTTATVSNSVSETTTTPSPQFVSESIEGHYRYAALASDAGPCSRVGTDMMARKGASVVDATIAALLCQCVHNFHSCGIGGGFFMTVYNRANKTAYTIIAREQAPAEANETMFVGRSSTEGGLSVGIPGEIRGYWLAHQLGGKLPWKYLFKPAIKFCTDGFPLGKPVENAIDYFNGQDIINRNVGLRDLLTNDETGNFYRAGELVKMPKLAKTLKIIAEEGADTFYNGTLAKDIVADIQDAGGIITEDDLANYVALRKDPLEIKLNKNQTVYSPVPPSSGAVYQFILNILDGYGLSNDSVSSAQKEILTWHRFTEACKFAYAKRTNLGDGDVESLAFRQELNELVTNMTSEEFANKIRSEIWDNQTHGTYYYEPTFYNEPSTGTAHLSVLAPNGDAASVTSTINLYFGSKIVGTRTGIIFNNEMDDFSTPNTVNAFGVPASPANFIKPGKRPLSSMSPSIAVDSAGMVNLVVGASGGTKIISSVAYVTLATLWLGKDIKEAIDHRRMHHQLVPQEIAVEHGFPQYILDGLKALGHNISQPGSAGSVVQGILQLKEEEITANSDFRKLGYPDGY